MITSIVTALALLADPVQGAPELTHNALYKQGKLAKVTCSLKKGTSKASTEKYVKNLVACLSKSWKPLVPEWEEPRVRFLKEPKGNATGVEFKDSFIDRFYGLDVYLANDWIKAKDDLAIQVQFADAFARVVMDRAGITLGYRALPNDGDEKLLQEHRRRFDYQVACLTGVTMKALGRTSKNWKPLLRAEAPHPVEERYHRIWQAKVTKNEFAWFTQGYRAGSPKACNTWKASESRVS
ncbi:hypothetical protein [Nonomuraea soli]|uniref:Metalloprotease n=1 Tax=Nonomuraea soli TaxID=1032476 RepID=A0A7W0CJ35_9ACTN|nr:hypothetical protein [Nonomuraea soli]MBA2892131.1 hypothetical protein [Nonomuraea soli]